MFEKITPEQAGISSSRVADFISVLERRGFATHSLLMMKGDKLFAEYYWSPFNKDFCHRMYSQTKSYVSIAIFSGKYSIRGLSRSIRPVSIPGILLPESAVSDSVSKTFCTTAEIGIRPPTLRP